MMRTIGKLGATLLVVSVGLISGCRRGAPPEPKSERESPSAGVVVDEGCPHMVDGKCLHSPEDGDPDKDAAAALGTQSFGAALGASPQVALTEVLSAPDKYHDKKVTVSGHVSRACSRKGCWMELAVDKEKDAERCRITFKDYGFFVPTNAAGSHAKLEGTVQVTQVKKAAVDHYESEGATFDGKLADGSAREVRLIATGVELTRI